MNPEQSNALREKIRSNPKLCPELSNPNCYSGAFAVVESTAGNDALAAPRLQETVKQRFLVRFYSVRKRLLDEDNQGIKFWTDRLRYMGLIPNDDPTTAKIEVSQRKCEEGEPEHVEIIIERL